MTGQQATRGAHEMWRRSLRAVLAPLRATGYAWRRSIQARVVISTVVLCAAVVLLVGAMLLRQVAAGLVDGKRDASIAQAQAGFDEAQAQLDATLLPESDSPTQVLDQLFQGLQSRSGSPPSYDVILEGPVETIEEGVAPAGVRKSRALDPSSIPDDLRSTVEASQGTFWTYSDVNKREGDSTEGAVVVGSRLQLPSTGEVVTLYYLFPMTEQQQTLSLLARGLLGAALALLALVALVAYLVTRQVVTPVRLARRIAERLAAGRLEERMHVRGEDDIARLGLSFNQMAASLQTQIRQLEELSRVQRRFVSDVSHELRTPLTTVRMAADVLHDARQKFDPVTARSAELLQAELDRFESLLTDLLEISRFDAGAARLDLEEIDLTDVASRVAESYAPLAQRHDVRLEVIPAGAVCLVEADVRRIDRIVRNLVANAINYSRSEVVQIRLGQDADAVALAVRDFGVGLHPGEATLVFNRFWRADPARARTSGGTGLGLAIAAEDAALHGGWLQAWGEPDKGAQFRLTLPRTVGSDVLRSPLPLVPTDTSPAIGLPYQQVAGDTGQVVR